MLDKKTSSVKGWNEHAELVLHELERSDKNDKEINKKLDKILGSVHKLDKRILVLEVKSGIWGLLGGILSGGGMIWALLKIGVFKIA